MSRLDSFIRRLQAQRSCLDLAAELVRDLPGPVLEFGLGNGRTYDHLRGLFPNRDIYVFERKVAAHPDCVPDDDHLLLGDFNETLASAPVRIGQRAAFAHGDIGSGDSDANAALADWLAGVLPALLLPGAIVVGDQALANDQFQCVSLPDDIAKGRYFIYRFQP